MSTTGVKTSIDKFIEEVVNAAVANDAPLLAKILDDNKEFSLTRSFSGRFNAVHHVGKTGNQVACDLILKAYFHINELIYGAAYGGHEACTLHITRKGANSYQESLYETAAIAALDGNHTDLCLSFIIKTLSKNYNKYAMRAIHQKLNDFAVKLLKLAGTQANYNEAAVCAVKTRQDTLCIQFLNLAGSKADYHKVLETALSLKNTTLARSIIVMGQQNGCKVVDKSSACVAASYGLDMALEMLASSGAEIVDYLDAANTAGQDGYEELQSKILKVRGDMISRKQAITPMFNAASSTSTSEVAQLSEQFVKTEARLIALELEVNKLKGSDTDVLSENEVLAKKRKIG